MILLRKASKEYLFIFITFGLSILYSLFAVSFAAGWFSDLNILFTVLAGIFLLAYILLIQLDFFSEKKEEYLYLAGITCFLIPVIYGIGQSDPLLIKENLSSVYSFIFFSGILSALKKLLASSNSFNAVYLLLSESKSQNVAENKEFIEIESGDYCVGSCQLLNSGAVFEIEDGTGVLSNIYFAEGADLPAGARLVAPLTASIHLQNTQSRNSSVLFTVYLKSTLNSLKALAQRYMLTLMLGAFSLVAIFLSHFPYANPTKLSLWFQLAGGICFLFYLIFQLRRISVVCVNFAMVLFRSGCQVFDFQRILELAFRVKSFRLKLSGNSNARILAETRIIDEQVSPQKLNELLFYLIADSKNPDFALIRRHLKFGEINPASFNMVQKRIETPTGITAWIDSKKLYLGNEAFIIQNGVFVNASEYLSFDSGNNNIFFAIDQELLAGFILEDISDQHLKFYADKLKGTRVVIDNLKESAPSDKNLSQYGLTVKSAPVGNTNKSPAAVANDDLKLLLADNIFAPSEIADIYFPQPNWNSLRSFFFGFERLRKILLINAALIFLLFLIIFSSATLLVLSQLLVLLAVIFMASITFQVRYLERLE